MAIMTLEQYLKEKELKPSAFAAEIGVAPSTITRLLKGERGIGLKVLRAVSEGTGGAVTADDFFQREAEARAPEGEAA